MKKNAEKQNNLSVFYFDKQAADNAIRFIESHCRYVEGEWALKDDTRIKLEPWQKKIISDIIGWKVKETGLRKYREVYLEVPRKNAKSTLIACFIILGLFVENEPAAQFISAASNQPQAKIVHEIVKKMIAASPELSSMSQSFRDTILYENKTYKAISADAKGKHGANTAWGIIDELHEQPDRDLYDVIRTSMGSRRQPLLISITTAGQDLNSICYELHEHTLKVNSGVIVDESFYGVIYGAEPKDDWTDPKVWKKANPNYGVSIKPDFLLKEFERAKNTPSFENTFKRLYLNIWTNSKERWLSDVAWVKNNEHFEFFDGDTYGALDLSSTSDLSAFTIGSKTDKFKSKTWFWLPEEKARNSADKNNINYSQWVKEGLIKETSGNVIDYEVIIEDIINLCNEYNVKVVAYDPYNALQVILKLEASGINCFKHSQGILAMTSPLKEFERLIVKGDFVNNENKVLRWMAGNAVLKTDNGGNCKLDRSKQEHKIDGLITNVMCLSMLMMNSISQSESYLATMTEEDIKALFI